MMEIGSDSPAIEVFARYYAPVIERLRPPSRRRGIIPEGGTRWWSRIDGGVIAQASLDQRCHRPHMLRQFAPTQDGAELSPSPPGIQPLGDHLADLGERSWGHRLHRLRQDVPRQGNEPSVSLRVVREGRNLNLQLPFGLKCSALVAPLGGRKPRHHAVQVERIAPLPRCTARGTAERRSRPCALAEPLGGLGGRMVV